MKKKLIYLIIAAAVMVSSSCKKFLTVQPQDRYTQNQVFSTESGIQQALNGLYSNMASNSLYGANLSTTVIEMMAQRFNTTGYNATTGLPLFQAYNYTDATSMGILNTIWTSTYANILQTNQFISSIDDAVQKGIIPAAKAAELKGEAIGIRALQHLDMLRLFGPVFKTTPNAAAIPYYTKADGLSRPILTAGQAIDSILVDLSTAKTLLSDDPVISSSGVNLTSNDFYSGHRNQRLNYYAVIALQARAYLYKGDKVNANATVKDALAAFDSKFPWLITDDPNQINPIVSNANPDRTFSTEVVFGIYNQNMYLNNQTYFFPTASNNGINVTQVLTAFPARLGSVFENNTNDYRYTTTWLPSNSGTSGTLYFNKYADMADLNKPWRFVQPMIRKSELYYILAETEPVAADGINYLNRARNKRNLINLAPTAVLSTELQKEYQKEFWGEGQLFFYYKRNAVPTIPSALNNSGSVTPNYLVPLPLSEITPR